MDVNIQSTAPSGVLVPHAQWHIVWLVVKWFFLMKKRIKIEYEQNHNNILFAYAGRKGKTIQKNTMYEYRSVAETIWLCTCDHLCPIFSAVYYMQNPVEELSIVHTISVLSRLKAQMVCGKLLLILCFVFPWAKVLPWWLHRKEPIFGWLWYFTIFLGDRPGSSVWMVCSADCATFGRVYLSCFVLFPNQAMMLPVWILLMVQVKKFISTLKGILKSLKYIK